MSIFLGLGCMIGWMSEGWNFLLELIEGLGRGRSCQNDALGANGFESFAVGVDRVKIPP